MNPNNLITISEFVVTIWSPLAGTGGHLNDLPLEEDLPLSHSVPCLMPSLPHLSIPRQSGSRSENSMSIMARDLNLNFFTFFLTKMAKMISYGKRLHPKNQLAGIHFLLR